MDKLKEKFVLILAGVIFALCLGLNVFSFADYCHAKQVRQTEQLCMPQGVPASTTTLDSWKPVHRLIFRSVRSLFLDSLSPRTPIVKAAIGFRSVKKLFLGGEGVNFYPTPHAFGYSKEYYVYTLKRILC